MVRTGTCGISRKIEGTKSIVLVDLCVSAAQGLGAITLLLSRACRVSEFLQHCCKVKGFKKSSETVCSHCCPLYCFQIQKSAHAQHCSCTVDLRWAVHGCCLPQGSGSAAMVAFEEVACEKGRASCPSVPNQTAQPHLGDFRLLLFHSSLQLIYASCCASRAVRHA